MSKDLTADAANAVSLIEDHIRQHGRDMYGDCLGLREAQAVLRDCAAALKKAAIPPPAGETVIPAEIVKAAGAAGAKGRAGGA